MFLLAACASLVIGIAVAVFLDGGWNVLLQSLAEVTTKPEKRYQELAGALGLDWDEERIRQEVRRDLRYTVFAFLGSIALLPFISFGHVVFLGAIALTVAYYLPKSLLRRRKDQKWLRFEEDLPDAMIVMVQSMRAGDALIESIRQAGQRIQGPIRDEFELIYREYSLRGMSADEVLDRARKRIPTEGFKMVSSALILGSRQGGDLLDVLQRLSDAIRALSRLRRKIYVETSDVRMQEKVAVWLTPAFGLIVCLFDPGNLTFLFSTFRGNVILVIVFLLEVFGVLTIRSIVRATI
jgi:tight adherence protein B